MSVSVPVTIRADPNRILGMIAKIKLLTRRTRVNNGVILDEALAAYITALEAQKAEQTK